MVEEKLSEYEKDLLEEERNRETGFQQKEGTILATDIKFYLAESDILGNRRTAELLKERNLTSDLEALDLHAPLSTCEEWEIEWDFGRGMYNSALAWLKEFADHHLSRRESLKTELMFSSAFLDGDERVEIAALHSYFEEDGLETGSITPPGEGEKLRPPEVTEEFLEEYGEDLGERWWTAPQTLTKAFALDTIKTLQRKAPNKEDPEEYADKCNEFERFFARASPANRERLEDSSEYTVAPVESREGIKNLGLNTAGSCLFNQPEAYGFDSNREMFYDHPLEEAFMMWDQDPGTFYHAIGKDGELRGYIRAFLLEDSDGYTFAGIDTVEVPKSGGLDIEDVHEDFSAQSDVISAGVFGAIPYYMNIGVDYVAGKESRVSYGPRQSFGNTGKKIEYRKIGDTVPYYSVYKDKERKGPGWSGYSNPEDEEIRGFRTEPGWHETSNAYILMEDPKNLPESPTM